MHENIKSKVENIMKKEVHEIFAYPFDRAKIDPDFLTHYLQSFEKAARKSYWFKYFPHKILYKQADYIFLDTKYIDLIKSLSSPKILVLTGLGHRKKVDKYAFFFPHHYFIYTLHKVFITDPMLKEKISNDLVDFTVSFLKKINPKALILSNDSLFLERFLIFCARKAGIKSICIQDGIFQSTSNPILFHGKYTDFFYVWSEKQKNMFIRHGYDKLKLVVYGYPLKMKVFDKDTYNSNKVCLLGQPWEKYSKTLGIKKKKIFNDIVLQLATDHIVYKSHPGETEIEYFPDDIKIFHGNLSEAIEKYDYFLSFTSTALIEVSLAKKIAIQLYDQDFNSDIFEDIGYCYTFDVTKKMKFKSYLKDKIEPYHLDKNTLLINKNLGMRFLELEKELI